MTLEEIRNLLHTSSISTNMSSEKLIGKNIRVEFYRNLQTGLKNIRSIVIEILSEGMELTRMKGKIITGKKQGKVIIIDLPFEGMPLLRTRNKMYVLKELCVLT